MAPQRPEGKHRSRPSSSTPSPTKSSPRKSADKRRSRDPEGRAPEPQKETARRAQAPERERERARGGGAADDERRRSAQSSPTKGAPQRGSPKKATPKRKQKDRIVVEYEGSQTSSNALSADSLARLDALNARDVERERRHKDKEKEKVVTGRVMKERMKHKTRRREEEEAEEEEEEEEEEARAGQEKRRSRRKHRVVSGGTLEQGLGRRGGGFEKAEGGWRSKKKMICIGGIISAVLLAILIPVGVLVVGKQNGGAQDSSSSGNLNGVDPNSVPPAAKGSYLDPFTWLDTQDFNATFTNDTVGGLPVMGLNSTWDDSVQANQYVPALNKAFKYGQMPIRGVNIGGWLSLEPFITPSLFDYDQLLQIVDEYTLSQHLGPDQAAKTIEAHYSTFINKQSFADIRAAGFDHVRIPYSYWAVTTYPGDPYVPKISWRYLLRGIEYARENGLRVNLDLHALPGSQNGWNHSGRQGPIGWLNGTDGALNGQRSLDLHAQLAAFFAQPRYANVVGLYGLVNEPRMISLPTQSVLDWTASAVALVRQKGVTQWIAFGDGFLGLPNWQGKLQGIDRLVMDAHQYVIFNNDQIAFDHKTKLEFSCAGWSGMMQASINTASGFGPTLCGEWSQADTDCAPNLNNAFIGSRWTGTLDLPDPSLAVSTPCCPTKDARCSCAGANADPAQYSAPYKTWLRYSAEAQMASFEVGLGWFYWTWLTEAAPQWSWKLGMAAGILPAKVWDRDFNCSGSAVPDFAGLGLPETY